MGEEKRLAYVGVTRAMDRLYLLSVQVGGWGRAGQGRAGQGRAGQGIIWARPSSLYPPRGRV